MNSKLALTSSVNKFIQREYRLSNSPFEAVTSIPQEELTYFCNLDARHGLPVTITGKFHLMLNHVHSPALLHHLVDMCVIELHLE